jgi:hypothetical protein
MAEEPPHHKNERKSTRQAKMRFELRLALMQENGGNSALRYRWCSFTDDPHSVWLHLKECVYQLRRKLVFVFDLLKCL